jgi:hypothetical protein
MRDLGAGAPIRLSLWTLRAVGGVGLAGGVRLVLTRRSACRQGGRCEKSQSDAGHTSRILTFRDTLLLTCSTKR